MSDDVKVVACIYLAMPGMLLAMFLAAGLPVHLGTWWTAAAYLGTYVGLIGMGYNLRKLEETNYERNKT